MRRWRLLRNPYSRKDEKTSAERPFELKGIAPAKGLYQRMIIQTPVAMNATIPGARRL